MNLLKSKLEIFSLLAVFTLSLLFTSCADDKPTPQPTPQLETEILILKSVAESEIKQIVAAASEVQMIQFRNNYLTFQFLDNIGKLDDAFTGTEDDFSFSLDHLTEAERAALDAILLDPEDRAGCRYVGAYVCVTIPTKVCKKWGVPYPCNWRTKCAGASGKVCWS